MILAFAHAETCCFYKSERLDINFGLCHHGDGAAIKQSSSSGIGDEEPPTCNGKSSGPFASLLCDRFNINQPDVTSNTRKAFAALKEKIASPSRSVLGQKTGKLGNEMVLFL